VRGLITWRALEIDLLTQRMPVRENRAAHASE
jgi:hypothetical protein